MSLPSESDGSGLFANQLHADKTYGATFKGQAVTTFVVELGDDPGVVAKTIALACPARYGKVKARRIVATTVTPHLTRAYNDAIVTESVLVTIVTE